MCAESCVIEPSFTSRAPSATDSATASSAQQRPRHLPIVALEEGGMGVRSIPYLSMRWGGELLPRCLSGAQCFFVFKRSGAWRRLRSKFGVHFQPPTELNQHFRRHITANVDRTARRYHPV